MSSAFSAAKEESFLPNPWQMNRTTPEPAQDHRSSKKNEPREIKIEAGVTSFAYEADVFGNALLAGKQQAPAPAMTWDDSLGNIRHAGCLAK